MIDESIIPQEDRVVDNLQIARGMSPSNIEQYEEQYSYYEKVLLDGQRWVLFIAARQGAILLQLKELHKDTPEKYFLNLGRMGLRETTAQFKIRLAKLLAEFPELRWSSLSLNIANKYLRQIRKVCESSGDKYK